MGALEEKNRKRIRRDSVRSTIFTTLAVGGVIALGGGERLMVEVLRSLLNGKKKYKTNAIRQAVFRLLKEDLIYFDETPRGNFIRLTKNGQKYLAMFSLENNLAKRPKKWDGKWRVVIFDINEKKRFLRNRFRQIIARFGFYRLQDSVWVYPYECEEFMILAKAQLKIGREILYMIVDLIEADEKLRKHFKLS